MILGEKDESADNAASQKFIDSLHNVRSKQSTIIRGDDADHYMMNWESSWQDVERQVSDFINERIHMRR